MEEDKIMNISEELKKNEAKKFKENNGLVLRTIIMFHRRGYFTLNDLFNNLLAYEISKDEILCAIDYLEDEGMIEARMITTKELIHPCDAEENEIEIRVRSNGQLVLHNVIDNPGIEL